MYFNFFFEQRASSLRERERMRWWRLFPIFHRRFALICHCCLWFHRIESTFSSARCRNHFLSHRKHNAAAFANTIYIFFLCRLSVVFSHSVGSGYEYMRVSVVWPNGIYVNECMCVWIFGAFLFAIFANINWICVFMWVETVSCTLESKLEKCVHLHQFNQRSQFNFLFAPVMNYDAIEWSRMWGDLAYRLAQAQNNVIWLYYWWNRMISWHNQYIVRQAEE